MHPTLQRSREVGLGIRLGCTAALALAEVVAVTILVDTGNLSATTWLAAFVRNWAASGLRLLVLALLLTIIVGAIQARARWKSLSAGASGVLSIRAATLNLIALAAFATLALRTFDPHAQAAPGALQFLLCAAAGLSMLASVSLVFVPLVVWRRFLEAAPMAPVYGTALSLVAGLLLSAGKWMWIPWMRLTYRMVVFGLGRLHPDIVTDPSTFTVGTRRFSVIIASGCSGYEGIVLMLVFGSMWLWFFRREFRFPRAALLLPVGALAMWLLNALRIIVLILIGDAGAPAVAAGGFHSEAGWIAFVLLAVGISLASRRVGWIASRARQAPSAESPETAAFLLPFLAILAAGMLAHAASASFEWLYPLRVLAAAAVLWRYRRLYAAGSWRAGWESMAIGIAVFAIWIAAGRLAGQPQAGPPAELAAAPALQRVLWIAFRLAGAVATVPIAEELAFRGYALRRLQSVDFTAVDLRKTRLLPVLISSALFGWLHGANWIAGFVAGVFYAAAARRHGRLADAVVAHALTNALLALWVLGTGNWALW